MKKYKFPVDKIKVLCYSIENLVIYHGKVKTW